MSADRSQRRRLSEEERTLWGRIIRSVRPLRRKRLLPDSADPSSAPAKTNPPASARVPAAAHSATTASKAIPKPAPKPIPSLEPLSRRQRQRLARGTQDIDARIDLHGRTQSQAHAAL